MSARFRIMSVSVLVGLATSLSFSLCHNAAAEPQTLFFTDATAGFVYSINPDGTGLTPIVTAGGSVSYGGVAVDILNERVYFSDATNSEVIRVDTDGANSLTLTSSALFVRSVAVDPSRNKVFYTPGTGNKTIVASDLDGGGAVTIYSPGPGGPEDLKVDTDAAKIYFADGGDNTIKRINEDGSGVETYLTGTTTQVIGFDGAGKPIAVDPSVDIH